MHIKPLLTWFLLSLASSAWADAPTPAAGAIPPNQVIQTTANAILTEVAANKDKLNKQPMQLYEIVQKDLLPHFDSDRATHIVLGVAWRNTTVAQHKAFQDAFIKYMIHNYADGLLQGDYSARNLQVDPWHGSESDKITIVKTHVLRPNAQPVEVDYQMVNTPQGWKAFDVTIEGISYVMSYAGQFKQEIQVKGLDELTKRLSDAAAQSPVHAG